MAERIPERHLVVIAAAATAAVSLLSKQSEPRRNGAVRIRIRIPIRLAARNQRALPQKGAAL